MGKNINDIDSRFSIDYSDFKTGIKVINRGLVETRSEFKAVSAGMDNWRTSTEGVTAKLKSLDSVLIGQKAKLKQLELGYEELIKDNKENSKVVQDHRIKLNNQKAAVERVEKEMRQWSATLNKLQQEQSESAIKTKQLTSQIEKLDKFSNGLGNFANNMSMYVTVPILGAMAAMGKGALDLEATEAKYNTVFGNMVDDMQEYIDEWQTLVPATEVGARNIASGIQDLFVPMGFYRKEAQGMTESTMTLVGALANFNSAKYSAADIANKFTSAITGQYKPLKDIGIVTSKANVEQRAYAMGLDMSTESAKKQSMAVALMQIAYEQSGDALAAFNEESLDTKSKLNIALNELKDVGAEFGQEFIPIVIRGVEALNDVIDKLQEMTPASRKTIIAVGAVAASIGPLSKGLQGVVSGISTIKKIQKSLNLATAAAEVGSVATATSSLAVGVSSVLGPLGIAIGAITAISLLTADYREELRKSDEEFKANLGTATEFYSLLEKTEPIDKFNEKLETTSANAETVNDSINDINTNIEFKINEQAIKTAKDTINDLKEAHTELLLLMNGDSASEFSQTINTAVNDSLEQRKQAYTTNINNLLNDDSLSDAQKTEGIRELADVYDSIEKEVYAARDAILATHNAANNGDGLDEAVSGYEQYVQSLTEITGLTEEQITGISSTLIDQQSELFSSMNEGLTNTEGFESGIRRFADTLSEELIPVQTAVNSAIDNYHTRVDASISQIDKDIEAKQKEIEFCGAMEETYDSLATSYDATANNYGAYIDYMLNGSSKLSESQKLYVDSLKTYITEEEELALVQVGLGDQYGAYVDFMDGKTIDLNFTREDSLQAFKETLSEEGQAMLENYDSNEMILRDLINASEEYKDSAISHQEELNGMDRAELISQAEADAQSAALATMTQAVDDFAAANGIDLPTAFATLQTALSENGITLDTELANMITGLTDFSSDLTDTAGIAGTDSFDELIAPFEDAESEGENLINNIVAGIEKGVEEKSEDVKTKGSEMGQTSIDGLNDGAGVKSPSYKAANTGKFIIQGLVQGLNQNAMEAYGAAQNIADTVVAIIDSAWDINSPSKVGISKGGYLMQGIGIGLKKESQNTYKELQQIMASMTAIASNKVSNYNNYQQVSNVQTYHNQKTQKIAPNITFQGVNDEPRYRAVANRLTREIVAAVNG